MIGQEDHQLSLASRLAGAAWGVLVGDALGVPYEFGPARPAGEVAFGVPGGPWRQPPGTWSDDGALTLALLDSLLHAGPEDGPAFDLADQGHRFRAWRDNGAYTPDGDGRFDVGATTFRALARLDGGVNPADAGPRGERECGNGSLMRILPLALVHRHEAPARLVELAHLASRVTHGHPRCQVACAVYCLLVSRLLKEDEPEAALKWALAECGRAYASDAALASHAGALSELIGYGDRTGSGFVLDAFWSAWDAFAGAADYAHAVRRAVAYGHDTDTTAAIAGGLAGARFGWASIPAAWRRAMRGHAVAQQLVDALVETVGARPGLKGFRTSTGSPLRVDLLDLSGTELEGRGAVGMTFLPGKKQRGQSGLHWRDLELDLARLRALGVGTLLLLVEDDELQACLVPDIEEAMAAAGPELVRFPVHDPRTPEGREREFRAALRDLIARVRAGGSVAIACRGGMDRSGMTAACLYRELGLGADEAIRRVQAARSHTITIREQQQFVRDWPWGVGTQGGKEGPMTLRRVEQPDAASDGGAAGSAGAKDGATKQQGLPLPAFSFRILPEGSVLVDGGASVLRLTPAAVEVDRRLSAKVGEPLLTPRRCGRCGESAVFIVAATDPNRLPWETLERCAMCGHETNDTYPSSAKVVSRRQPRA